MYIVFEGIVGSGKSTQSKRLVAFLREKYGTDMIVHVREPGSTPIAEDIRTLAQGKEWENETMHPLTNAYLYAAARTQTLHTVVKPALEAGKIVISDRSFLSSCAYQGEAQGLGIDTILAVNEEAIRDIFPDRVFYMDIDIEVSLSRTFDAVGDKWEKMGKEFFQSIARGYDKCEKLEIMENRFIRIDASGTQDEIFQNILTQVDSIIMLKLISTLQSYGEDFPDEKYTSDRISEWIEKYGEFAFVKENLEGHITASILITNPLRTRVLLMFHKKFQTWTHFGGHCDGEIDVKNVALREFHEESGILENPDIIGDIFSLQIWNVAERTSSTGMFQPDHHHYDILYLANIPEDTPFSHQESEVDDIRWFDIDGIEKYIGEKRMLDMIQKIKILGK